MAADLEDKAFRAYLFESGKSVRAWESVHHLKEGVRLNTTILGKIDNLRTAGKIPTDKLDVALKNQLGEILDAADNTTVNKILDRLNMSHVNEAHFDKITQRLTNPEYKLTLLKDLMDNPQWFEDFDKVIENPGKYWDVYNEGDFPLNSFMGKWGQGYYLKDLKQVAKGFEDGAALTRFKSENGISTIVEQVTLEVDGIRIRIDYIGRDANGKYHLGDAKFSKSNKNWSRDWLESATPNQQIVFSAFQNNNANSIIVKATEPSKLTALSNIGLGNNSSIDFSNSTLKIFGSEANQDVVKTVVSLKN
ncbi:MAG: hypothetical protein M9911_05305 [Saprospiraceae bacterium]|nr:hypothetical protein [Saprospiraceae bacterium]